jgi:hypothetical protein
MNRRRLRWVFALCAAAAAAQGCGEARVALLEPLASGAGANAPDGSPEGVLDADALRRAACNRWSVEREPEPALLMPIIDVSGTMAYPATQGATASKWDIERSVLGDAVGSMPAKVGMGILYFPNMPTVPSATARPVSACVNLGALVPIALLGTYTSRQRSDLAVSLASTEPNLQGGAPTLDAFLAGLDELGRSQLDGTRNMLLITDGQPTFSENCVGNGTIESPVDPSPIVNAIYSARRAGVRTFVIGSPGSQRTNSRGDDARPWLSRAAEAGGTAGWQCSHSGPDFCHYDMTRESNFGRALRDAFGDIERRIVRCDVPLPDPPQSGTLDPGRVNVVFTSNDGTSTVVVHDESQACRTGWRYSNDQRSVVLCDATCEAVNGELGSKLELVFGCESITP